MNSRRLSLPLAFLAAAGLWMTGHLVHAAEAPGSAPTLRPPTTAESTLGADGFIQRWLVLEPIPADGLTEGVVRTLVRKEHFPNQLTVLPKDAEVRVVLEIVSADDDNHRLTANGFLTVDGRVIYQMTDFTLE